MRRDQVNRNLELKRAQQTVFTNFTDKDFTHTYDGVPYTVKSGESRTLELFKAELLAKHFIDRELNREGKNTNDSLRRFELLSRCITEGNIEDIEDTAKNYKNVTNLDANISKEPNSEINVVNVVTPKEKEAPSMTTKEEEARKLRTEGIHWKVVQKETGVSPERQRELL